VREADIQREIVDYLKMSGYMVFRMNAGQVKKNVKMHPAGTPDILSISPKGRHLWVEVKTEEGTVSGVQQEVIDELIRRGDSVIVARSVGEVEQCVRV
jgi:Holliday junction resolvase